MNNVWVFPYKPGSNSARDLARSIGVRRISHTNSRFQGRLEKTVINWGASHLPEEVAKCTVLNIPEAVNRASDKLKFFENADCRKPEWTTDWMEALEWLNGNRESTVVVRNVLNGHSGEGIELVGYAEPMPDNAPLYTMYVPKKQEYRVHVFHGEVIDVQRKARRRDVADEDVNWKVRNNANGFVFARNGDALGDVPPDVLEQATNAVDSLDLDFGAADVIFNEHQSLAYVLEVNTAPGLVGTTLDNYARAFRYLLED
jgi:glutathione synthase/RimK-type ligase-like ATP-grasp enzyme